MSSISAKIFKKKTPAALISRDGRIVAAKGSKNVDGNAPVAPIAAHIFIRLVEVYIGVAHPNEAARIRRYAVAVNIAAVGGNNVKLRAVGVFLGSTAMWPGIGFLPEAVPGSPVYAVALPLTALL